MDAIRHQSPLDLVLMHKGLSMRDMMSGLLEERNAMVNRKLQVIGTVGLLAMTLAACDSSGRFSDFGPGRQAVAPPPPPQTFTPAPTGRVQSSPLPPPPGGSGQELGGLPPVGSAGALPASGLPPVGSSVPIDPEPPRVESRMPAPQVEPAPTRPPQVASRPDPAPVQPSAPSRTSVTGNWNAKEAAGNSCKVTLSSTPTLDLYKASSSGCQSREMQRVSAWELRGEEIYLYEPGGGVSARLKQSGRNFEGSSAKTGAPVVLSK